MDPITDLTIVSVDLVSDQTVILFSFVKPSGNIGGYNLFMSTDNSTFSNVYSRVDYVHTQEGALVTYDSSGRTYFEYTLPSADTDGMLLYFKIQAVSTLRAVSAYSSVVTVYSYPSKISNLSQIYNNYTVVLNWDELDQTAGKNATLQHYNIYRYIAPEVTNAKMSITDILTSSQFTVGLSIWVLDIFKRSQWFGTITTEGEFSLADSKLTEYSDNSSEYNAILDNLKVFIENTDSEAELGTSSTGIFEDSTIEKDKYYIYSVEAEAIGPRKSSMVKFPSYTIDIEKAYPYLRAVSCSSTGILSSPYWSKIKSTLTDKNFYDKSSFAIPYSKNTLYNFKGYLGVSNCKLDVFINSIYSYTTSTGSYGEFDINQTFSKSITELKFQARDKDNIGFSLKSAPISIKTLNIYTWFSMLGDQYIQMLSEINSIKSDVSITNARYSYFEDIFSPFIELYKYADEDETKFKTIATNAFLSFEYGGYDASLEMVLDSFVENVAEVEHYKVYYNNSIFGNKKTSYSIIPTAGNIPRGNYYYAVSSGTLSGEESTAATIRVDSRWWGGIFNGYVALRWSETTGTEVYHIYRGTNENNLYYLNTIPGNLFIDSNGLTEVDYNRQPLPFNYTSLTEPHDLEIYDDVHTVNFNMRLKKPNWMTIIIYLSGNSLLQQIHIDRLRLLFSKLIAPEIRYSVIVAGNKYILYNWEPVNIDVTYFYCDGNLETEVYLLSNNARNGIATDEYLQYLLGSTTYGVGLLGITALFESRIYTTSNVSKVFGDCTFMFNCSLGKIELYYRKDYYSTWSSATVGSGETTVTIEGGLQSVQFMIIFKSTSWHSGDSIYYTSLGEI